MMKEDPLRARSYDSVRMVHIKTFEKTDSDYWGIAISFNIWIHVDYTDKAEPILIVMLQIWFCMYFHEYSQLDFL